MKEKLVNLTKDLIKKKSVTPIDDGAINLLKKKYPKVIKEIRGRGLLIGIQLYKDQSKFIKNNMAS